MLGIVASFYCPRNAAHFQFIIHTNQGLSSRDIRIVVHMGMFISLALAQRGL
jgi:hypothetical protein